MWMNRWKQTTNTTAHLHTRKTEGSGRRGGILWEKKMVFTKRKKKIALLVLSSGYDTYGHNHQIDACGSSFYASDTWLVRGVLCKTVPGDNGGHIKPSNDVKKLTSFFKKAKLFIRQREANIVITLASCTDVVDVDKFAGRSRVTKVSSWVRWFWKTSRMTPTSL